MPSRSYKIILGIFLAISALGWTFIAVKKFEAHRKESRIQRAKNSLVKKRMQESNSIAVKIEEGKRFDATAGAKTIDLSSHINAPLNRSFVPKNVNDNHLAELGEGTQTLAGIPFDIRGSLQLTGRDLRRYSPSAFPGAITGIRVDASCDQLHILHGSYFVKNLGITIAKLVLNYGNGVMEEIPIITGQHVLDWWAPNYETGVRADWRDVTAEGSTLAWVGSNPYIHRRQPHLSLRLFKSSFRNPRPDLPIATIDFVSTETVSAPFLLGLTTE